MRILRALALSFVLALGCSGSSSSLKNLPPAVESTRVYAGDELEISIVGEDRLPKNFTVDSEGQIDPPLIERIKVGGLEPQEITALIKSRLIAENVLMAPSVSVRVTQYKSKRIEVNGQVARASSISLEPGMTALRAITLAGGFSTMADRGRIKLRRRTAKGFVEVTFNEQESYSVILQAGDSIDVSQSVF